MARGADARGVRGTAVLDGRGTAEVGFQATEGPVDRGTAVPDSGGSAVRGRELPSMGTMPTSHETAPDHETFRAASAPWLTGFLVLLGLVVGISGWGRTPAHHAAAVLGALTLAGLGYTLYWRPRLEVHEREVRLVNPLRTVCVPWARIVDVSTRFAVTLVTDTGKHSSFALPAAGAGSSFRAGPDAVNRNHPIARPDGSVRVGDLTSTASGAAAHRVRSVWQRRIETGELDVFSADGSEDPVRVRLTPGPLTTTLVLGAASAVLFTL